MNTDLTGSDGYAAPSASKVCIDSTDIISFVFQLQMGEIERKVIRAVKAMGLERSVRCSLRDLVFEYDEEKNRKDIEPHGISFKTAARVFFDHDRIEMYDEGHRAEDEMILESRMICRMWFWRSC